MKILSLNVDNFLRIEALEIIPKGNSVTITGKNDQGKSSTLRAIDVALGGGKAPEDPVHRGANKAEIVVQLGAEKVEAIVKRTYVKRDGKEALATLTVTTPDGARWPKPQEFLDKVLGTLSLDPVKFLEMKAEDQAKVVRAFVPKFDFDANEKLIKDDYDKRTEVNREVKRIAGEVEALPAFTADWPTEMIDTAELVNAIETAAESNSKIELAKSGVDGLVRRVAEYDSRIADKKRFIEELEESLADAKENLQSMEDTRAGLGTQVEEAQAKFAELKPVDVQEAKDELRAADEVNDKVREYKQAETRRARLETVLKEQRDESEKLTKSITDLKDAAAKAIKDAEMPVEGLGFDEEGKVTLDGYPLANTSFSKRLLAAIAIAAAHAPTLRLVKIADGDKLDNDSQALLAKFADEHDLQIWQENVDHGNPIGFVIEDGKLKGYVE